MCNAESLSVSWRSVKALKSSRIWAHCKWFLFTDHIKAVWELLSLLSTSAPNLRSVSQVFLWKTKKKQSKCDCGLCSFQVLQALFDKQDLIDFVQSTCQGWLLRKVLLLCAERKHLREQLIFKVSVWAKTICNQFEIRHQISHFNYRRSLRLQKLNSTRRTSGGGGGCCIMKRMYCDGRKSMVCNYDVCFWKLAFEFQLPPKEFHCFLPKARKMYYATWGKFI